MNPVSYDAATSDPKTGFLGMETAPQNSDLLWGVNEVDADGNQKLGLSFALLQKSGQNSAGQWAEKANHG